MTYQPLLNLMKEDDLKGDPWGTVMHWWFAVSEELYWSRDEHTPESWEFTPGLGDGSADDDCHARAELKEVPTAILFEFGDFLCRAAGALDRRGFSY